MAGVFGADPDGTGVGAADGCACCDARACCDGCAWPDAVPDLPLAPAPLATLAGLPPCCGSAEIDPGAECPASPCAASVPL